MKALLIVLALAAVVVISPAAGGKASGTVDLVGAPVFGATVSFTATGTDLNPSQTDEAQWVWLACSQDGAEVSSETHLVADGAAGQYTLGPTGLWTGGDADCTATYGYGPDIIEPNGHLTHHVLGTLDFRVAG
jgi:hypothetical protein